MTGLQTRIVIPWKFAIFQKNNINIKSKITISGLLSSSKEFGPHGINWIFVLTKRLQLNSLSWYGNIQRSLTLFFTLKICFSIAQPITSWLPINPNKTFQRVSEGWDHKQINTKGMLCEEESANSSHILKFQSQGNVICYPVTQWWWLVWRKQVQRKKTQ